jgi:hypothetical protein
MKSIAAVVQSLVFAAPVFAAETTLHGMRSVHADRCEQLM